MFCNQCGAEIVGAGMFCTRCGSPVTAQNRQEKKEKISLKSLLLILIPTFVVVVGVVILVLLYMGQNKEEKSTRKKKESITAVSEVAEIAETSTVAAPESSVTVASVTATVQETNVSAAESKKARDYITRQGDVVSSMWLGINEYTCYQNGTTPNAMNIIEFTGLDRFRMGNLFEGTTDWVQNSVMATASDTLEIDCFSTVGTNTAYLLIKCTFEWSDDQTFMTYCVGDFCSRYVYVNYGDAELMNFINQQRQ